MEMKKISKNEEYKETHKKIAMDFLLSSNNELENPVSKEKIEQVYDLFAEEKFEQQSYQKSLDKIVKD